MRRHAALEAFEPFVVAEDAQIVVVERLDPALHHLADGLALGRVGQAHAVADDLAHRIVAGGAAEDEDDRRQHLAVRRAPRPSRCAGAPGTAGAAPPRACQCAERPVWSARRTAWSMRRPSAAGLPVVEQQGAQQRLAVLAAVHGEVVAQDDRPVALDDDGGVPPDRAQPAAELAGVVHGGREADEADLGRAEDEHLLPDPAAVGVLNEVDLVEHDRVQALEQVRARQQHVAQHLGGHDDHRRPRPQGGVAGQQPDVLLAVGGDQLPVLLVRQGLERRRVEGLAVGGQGPVHGVGGHQRLARPGRGGHQHRVPRVQRLEGLVLEFVEGEGEVGLELRRPGRPLDGPRERGQRPSSFPIPMERK